MPLCKAAFLADVQTFYLHLYPPSRLDGGLRMSQYFGMKRDEGVSRAESVEHGDISRHWNFRFDAFNNNASYIFQGATSNISSDCRLRTYIHAYVHIFANSWDTCTRGRGENRLPCIGTWNTFLTRSVRVRAHAIVTIHEFREIFRTPILYYRHAMTMLCLLLVLTWNRYVSHGQIWSSSYLLVAWRASRIWWFILALQLKSMIQCNLLPLYRFSAIC